LPGKKTDIRFPANDNILLVTVTGREAWQLAENKERIKEELFPVLKKVFGMPELPELKGEIELKNWGMDPRFLGAYSNPSVGTERSDFKTLSLPVGGKLFFAGEGLSQLYYGFLQGAYLTGEEQAKKIIAITQYQQSLSHLTVQRINYALRKKIPRK
jgi:polyamine oxidase